MCAYSLAVARITHSACGSDIRVSIRVNRLHGQSRPFSTAIRVCANQDDIERLLSAVDKIGGVKKFVFAVGLRIWPYCEAGALLQSVVKCTPASAPSLALVAPGPGAHIGDALIIDTRAPSFDGYIYIDYFVDAEGDVIHLFPNPKDQELARSQLALGRLPFNRCWTLGGSPDEQQLVTLTAATSFRIAGMYSTLSRVATTSHSVNQLRRPITGS
jgi:hypothetical protein